MNYILCFVLSTILANIIFLVSKCWAVYCGPVLRCWHVRPNWGFTVWLLVRLSWLRAILTCANVGFPCQFVSVPNTILNQLENFGLNFVPCSVKLTMAAQQSLEKNGRGLFGLAVSVWAVSVWVVSVWAVSVTGHFGQAVSVWGYFGHDVFVHKELITFIYLNDLYRQAKCHSTWCYTNSLEESWLRLNLNCNYDFDEFVFTCKMPIII